MTRQQHMAPLSELETTEWSDDFEARMRNRLILGAFRYGRMNEPNKPQYERVSAAVKRLHRYYTTGNLEHLVDVANLCLLEYVEGDHPKRHFRAVDDGDHVQERQQDETRR